MYGVRYVGAAEHESKYMVHNQKLQQQRIMRWLSTMLILSFLHHARISKAIRSTSSLARGGSGLVSKLFESSNGGCHSFSSTKTWATRSIFSKTLRLALVGSSVIARGSASQASSPLAAVAGAKAIEPQEKFDDFELMESEFRKAIIEKRPNDLREYRAILLPNKLRVLLISDKSTNRGAAALDVHVGSFSDPVDVPGLAHFAEHMCFLGTKKYPNESDFSKFLASHGGSSNAYTDSEDTVYYFDCNDIHLEPALDRFAQFFSAPLFTSSATSRELNAIESEHAKNINNDGFRLYQLDKDTANSDHPYSKFATGNKQTLETEIVARGINVRDELIKFHRQYYSSNQMTLSVIGNQNLRTLEKWVTEKFSRIPNTSVRSPEYAWWGKIRPFNIQKIAEEQQVVPIADNIRRMIITWPIWVQTPDLKKNWVDSKPESVIAHLLGHEGKGSLRSLIVAQGWGNGISASIGVDTSDLEQFEVAIDLTDDGLKHRFEIVRMVFGYIDLIKQSGIPPYILAEVSQLSAISFKFSEDGDPASLVSQIAADMQVYPPPRYLSGPRIIQPDVKEVDTYLSYLNPEQARIKSISPSFSGKTDKVAKWYGTQYKTVSLPSQTKEWKSAKASDYPTLKLPAPNELIPQNFDLLVTTAKSETERIKALEEHPIVLRNDSKWLVFHKIDRYYAQPKVYAIVSLSLPSELYNAEFAINARLFSYCFYDSLSEYSYEASLGGLGYEVEFTSRGLQITFDGYNDKFDIYVRKIMNELKSFRPDQKTFERYKDILTRELAAWKSQQPYQHCSYFASLVSETLQFSNEELKAALQKASIKSIDGFLDRFLSESFGTALLIGNYDASAANRLIDVIDSTFPFTPLEYSRRSRRRIAYTPVTSNGLILKNAEPNENDDNSASSFYFQIPSRDIEDYIMGEILAEVIEEPFYDDLRTKQQLGYIVGSGARGREGIVSLTLTAQSSVVDGDGLTERIESFLRENFLPSLENLSDDAFESFKEGLISRKLERDARLTKHASRLWSEIIASAVPSATTREFQVPEFDRQKREVAFISTLNKLNFVKFAENLLNSAQGTRRLLISQVSTTLPKSTDKLPKDNSREILYDEIKNGKDYALKIQSI